MDDKETGDHQEHYDPNEFHLFSLLDGLHCLGGLGQDRTGDTERNCNDQSESYNGPVSGDP